MNKISNWLVVVAALATWPVRGAEPFRPPAVPLVAHDPYFSIWSCADKLTDDVTRHWTHAPHPLASLIRIDGQTYRLMGAEPKELPALPQVGRAVLPTRTLYVFQGAGLFVTLTFLTPALPDELETLARPATYLSWDLRAIDEKPHTVALYASAGAAITVHTPDQRVVWGREDIGDVVALHIGSEAQPELQRQGDGVRIDWGQLYLAAAATEAMAAIGADKACTEAFVARGQLPASDDKRMPRSANDEPPTLALAFNVGTVGADTVSRRVIIAYDDVVALNYFGQKLKSYWRRAYIRGVDLLPLVWMEHKRLAERCAAFDSEFMEDLTKVGGEKYARLGALAYRQCLAGNKLAADAKNLPLLFPKENTSNGCIATVDVIYPMAPLFLLISPTLAKASLATVMNYAASDRWPYAFAPHDLGTYPKATGQVYGMGNEANMMPVEESGNMLLLLAAIARLDGNANFAAAWWPVVTKWAQYLEAKGFDPENQLCTDDFAGHLAHNANLSIKSIEALAAYGRLCELRGEKDNAAKYQALAKEMAAKWIKADDDGDHFRLTFDKPGTWSSKYNLVWDRILGLNVFPPEVARKEIAYYRKIAGKFGVPLDSRKDYAKLDWAIWTATLAEKPEDFAALVDPVYDFVHQVPERNPLTDWYGTKSGKEVGFHARPVVGGVFIKMLADAEMWKKWSTRDKGSFPPNWAPLPPPPQIIETVPTARKQPAAWRYTFTKPADNWNQPAFDATAWKEGPAGFGTEKTPGAVVRTTWNTADIWLRRDITLPANVDKPSLHFLVHHDEDVEIYLNGVLAGQATGYLADYEPLEMTPAGKAALKPGANQLAVHCHQTKGGQYIDVGLAQVVPGVAR